MELRDVKQYSPLSLAYLGDAVYERLVRMKFVKTANMPVGKLHSMTTSKVRAEFQAYAIDRIIDNLTDDEKDIVRRGRNTNGMTVPKHSSAIEYRKATSLECLFGFLELLEAYDRMNEIFEMIWSLEENKEE